MSTTVPRGLRTFTRTFTRTLAVALPRTLTRALAVALLVLGLAPPGIGPAAAHASLVASDPRDGATLDRLPGRISFTFSEDVVTPAYVVVRTADGADVTSGGPVVDGVTVTQELDGSAASGEVTMAYRVVSVDGHPVTGELAVTVREPASPSPDLGRAGEAGDGAAAGGSDRDPSGEAAVEGDDAVPAATSAESQGFVVRHVSHFLLGGFLVLAAVVLLLLSRKRPES